MLEVAVTSPGYVLVSINRAGIDGAPRAVEVHPITWTATPNSTTNTTAIDFVFGVPVYELEAEDFVLGGGAAVRGALTGGGKEWSLEVSAIRAGNVSVSIETPGIYAAPRMVTVQPIRWTATPNSATNTTAINFVFDYPVYGLTAEHFSFRDVPHDDDDEDRVGVVTRSVLTGEGAEWSLAVTAVRAGFLRVWIETAIQSYNFWGPKERIPPVLPPKPAYFYRVLSYVRVQVR